jgi:carboxymethylenebutenolidase
MAHQIDRRKLILLVIFIVTLLSSLTWSLLKLNRGELLAAHLRDYPAPTAIAQIEPKIPVTTERVKYATIDGETITGYLASPQAQSHSVPGIIAIHEWWGLNENIEAMARRLAGEGYRVLAVDLYRGKTATSPEQASLFTREVGQNPTVAKENLRQAYRYLVESQSASKIGSIGWCFGGSWSLQIALLFPQELAAAVIYYGGQIGEVTVAELDTLNVPILGIFGAEDRSIPVDTVVEFESTLDRLGKKSEIHIYPHAGHAFANPSGKNYVPEAAEKAWMQTIDFFKQYLAVYPSSVTFRELE